MANDIWKKSKQHEKLITCRKVSLLFFVNAYLKSCSQPLNMKLQLIPNTTPEPLLVNSQQVKLPCLLHLGLDNNNKYLQ